MKFCCKFKNLFGKKELKYDFYLAGPMRDYSNFNQELFDRISFQLRKMGYSVWSPAENNPHDRSFENCMKVDLNAIINECEGIVLLPGWRKSTGANVEVLVGNACGKKIYEIQINGVGLFVGLIELNSASYIQPYGSIYPNS